MSPPEAKQTKSSELIFGLVPIKPWVGYTVAVVGTALAGVARWGLVLAFGPEMPTYTTFYVVIILAAVLGGTGPGLLATFLSGVSAWVLFLEPHGSVLVAGTANQMGLILFGFLSTLVSLIGGGLRSARLAAVAEARRAEASADELAEVVKLLDLANVMVLEMDGRIVRWNTGMERLYGYTADQAVGKPAHDLLKTRFPQPRPVIYQLLLANGRWTGELVHSTADGRELVVNSEWVLWQSPGGAAKRILETHTDITERKRTEEALSAQRRLHESVTDNASLALFIMDDRQQCVFMNPAAEALTGFTLAETRGRPLHDVVHHTRPDGSPFPLSECPIGRAFPQNDREQGEEVFVHKDGHFYPVAFTASPLRDDTGKPVGTIIEAQDITARKQAEAEWRESEERLRFALSACHIGAWDIDLVEQTAFRSLEHDQIFGYAELLPQWTLEDFLKHALPEHHQPVLDMVRKATAARTGWTYECPIRRVDGQIRWIWFTGRYYTPVSGNPRVVGVVQDVTERKQAEEALRRSEARWSAAIESFAQGAIIATQDEQVIYWNPAARAMHGFTRPDEGIEPLEQTGTTFQLWTPDGSRMLELNEWPMRRIKRGESVRNLELRLRRPDQGWEKFFSYSGVMVDTAGGERLIFLSCSDLTGLRRTEEALRESEERFRTLADNISQFAWMADEKGWIFWYNRRWVDYTGTTLEQMQGWGWQQVHHPDHVQRVVDKFRAHVEAGEVWEDTFPLRGTDGQYRWFLSRAMPIRDEAGKVCRWFGTNTDVTDLLETEAELRRFQDELELRVRQRTAELAEANQELEAFGYSVSHDLRAPLRHVDSYIGLLQKHAGESMDEKGRKYMRVIGEAAKRMGNLIDDLLALSRLGRAAMEERKVSLRRIVDESRQQLAPAMAGRDIDWQVDPLPEVLADPDLLRAAMTNLLSNAIKYSRERKPARIVVGSQIADGELICFVRDNGAGFDMQFADKLFGVFQRLHHSRDFEGTGIGLASVRRVIHRHGGRTWAEGEPGQGATFYFSFPTERLAANQPWQK